MATVTIYHNPRCSKSREALGLVRECGHDFEVIEYLRQPPSPRQLERLLERLPGEPSELVRRDARFAELDLGDADTADAAAVVATLSKHPELFQRPVVVLGERAVIGRPAERVAELLKTAG